MENASKALIMAGTILIAVLILTLGVYVFNFYSDYAYDNQQRQAYQQRRQFNTKFEKYIGQDLTLQDVITIANLAEEYNEKYEDSGNRIDVRVQGIGLATSNDIDWAEKLKEEITKEDDEKTTYIINADNVNAIGYDNDGVINSINITHK